MVLSLMSSFFADFAFLTFSPLFLLIFLGSLPGTCRLQIRTFIDLIRFEAENLLDLDLDPNSNIIYSFPH
jgi:hypothetical protein